MGTTGIKVVDGAILTTTTNALCATDASCVTIADDAKECRHATTGVKTANRMKTSSTEFLCVADNAAKCGDANGIVSDNTLKKAKTSSTNDVCVTIADNAKSCR